jgi:serine/threonine protein kinase
MFRNRYRLEAELGHGGMGVVYRAHDTLLERDVAVKILSNSTLGTEGRARMLREAQAAARLNHPNIVSIYDAGEADDTSFIIMELLEGDSLYERKPPTLDETLRVIRQICNALEHAHTHGIIHRDLKPENVIVSPDGIAKLTDFGLARSIASRITMEGAIIGTIFYMAPEQALGETLDGRADLYALGVMLYELTTGRLPFTADDPVAVISQHLYASVVPPRTYNPDLPRPLDNLIVKLLSKRPEDRLESAAAVRQALSPKALEAEITSAPTSKLDQLVRGRLVCREREYAQAKIIWRQVLMDDTDQPVLFISGESGVGKTPLVREIKALADVSGGRALSGECYPEGSAPFAPIVQVLREALCLAGDDLPEFVQSDLAILLPDLRPQYPSDLPGQQPDNLSQQQRLYESVLTLFTSITHISPILLVLEDIQWADGETLYLIRHLARRIRYTGMRMLILLTYREAEIDASCCLTEVLSDLNRERLAERIKLARYDREQTRQVLEVMFQEQVAPDFVDAIYRETEGNLFYMEEICKALIEQNKLNREDGHWKLVDLEDIELPQSVRLTIQSRLVKLPSQVQDVLRLAAIIGREFDFDTLHAACELNEDALIDALETAEQAQLISEVQPGRLSRDTDQRDTFVFAHGLIVATLKESVSGLRRSRLHRRVAVAIEALCPEDFEALAYHYEQAKDIQRAQQYYQQAADRALAIYANNEAERCYRAAHELAEADLDCANLLSGLGEALFRLSRYAEAIQAWQEAITLYIKSNDNNNAARLYARTARAAWYGDSQERGLEICLEGMSSLPASEETPGMAALLHETARAYFFNKQPDKALPLCQQSLELSQRLGLIEVQADALATLGILPNQDIETKKQYLTQAVELAESASLLATASRAHFNLGGQLTEAGEFQLASSHLRQAYEQAKKLGNTSWSFSYLLGVCDILLELGDLQSIENFLPEARQLLAAIPKPGSYATMLTRIEIRLRRLQGEWETVTKMIQDQLNAEGPNPEPEATANNRINQAEVLLEQSHFAEAIPLLNEVIDALKQIKYPNTFMPLLLLSICYAWLDQVEPTRQTIAEMEAQVNQINIVSIQMALGWARAHLAAVEQRWEDVSTHFQTALKIAEDKGLRWSQARILLNWAELYMTRDRDKGRKQIKKHLEASLALFEQISAPGYIRRIRSHLDALKEPSAS